VWARLDVRRALARERIVLSLEPGSPSRTVASASAARALADLIREQTLGDTQGRTYAETDQYLASDGSTTSDRAAALVDERTGQPVANPEYELWIRSTTLQAALMQAYLAFRLADLTLAAGVIFVAAGAGIAARA